MNQVQIHPEHLMDRVLRGEASATERAELDAHLAACSSCRAERALNASLRRSYPPSQVRLDRLVEGALTTLELEGRVAPPSRGANRTARWLPWVAALCLFFTGSAAAATLVMVLRHESLPPPAAPSEALPKSRKTLQPAPSRAVATEPAPASPTSTVEPEPEQPTRRLRPPKRRALAIEAPKSPAAAELFRAARELSSQHQYKQAEGTYLDLRARYPNSKESHVASLLLARWYLERLSRPADALHELDRYLTQGGSNEPEALFQRARALSALGKRSEERRTLELIIERFGDSPYGALSKQRIGEL